MNKIIKIQQQLKTIGPTQVKTSTFYTYNFYLPVLLLVQTLRMLLTNEFLPVVLSVINYLNIASGKK